MTRIRASFDLGKPERFLVAVALASGAVAALMAVVVVVAVGVAGGQASVKGAIGIAAGVVYFLIPAIWIGYPMLVVGAVALGRPRSIPLAERNLLTATLAWVGRAFWGALLLVIGGFAGGFIAITIESIASASTDSGEYVEAASALITAVAGGVHFAIICATITGWFAVTWLIVALLAARREGRTVALRQVLRVGGERSSVADPVRRLAWVKHLSSVWYPVIGWVLLISGVGWVAGLVAGIGVEGLREAAIEFIVYIDRSAELAPLPTPTPTP